MNIHKQLWRMNNPPFIGWWLTNMVGGGGPLWRWWDGRLWSVPVGPLAPANIAAAHAVIPANSWDQRHVVFCDYWPEGSRVGRQDPITNKAFAADPEGWTKAARKASAMEDARFAMAA